MASQHSLNAEHHLHGIAQLSTVESKLDVIVKALNDIIRAVKDLEFKNPGKT